ncbi:alpha/beta hydrolase [Alicycliphilus denitrificans]|uniref:alpha/beta hydrolase n=1 Tax=Alicycliphilus denitrificans TaxID=179636 RepID=UPI00384FEF4C
MQRIDLQIPVPGATLAAWWYVPGGPGPHPAVAMAHGFGAVKEMFLDRFAECFAQAGLAVLVFDHRGFGASGGMPRQEADPVLQTRDYRHAITWLCARPEVDRGRIGIWGTSYSGGHVLQVAAVDRRVRCAVAQVPMVSGRAQTQRRVHPARMAAMHGLFHEERDRLAAGQAPRLRALIPTQDGAPSVYDAPEAVAFYAQGERLAPGSFVNAVTLSTVAHSTEYEPGAQIEAISPTPLLMIVATDDSITPTDLALAAYQRALEPKRLVLLPGDHFVPYEREFERASSAARDWLVAHLGASQ